MKLTSLEIADLQQLCEWLDTQNCKSAYSAEVADRFPHLNYWVSSAWKPQRKDVGAFYYQVGYGWRLHRKWRERLELARIKYVCWVQ